MCIFESTSLDKNHQMGFIMVHFNIKTQNQELVNLKCVTYAQPISVALISMFVMPFVVGGQHVYTYHVKFICSKYSNQMLYKLRF